MLTENKDISKRLQTFEQKSVYRILNYIYTYVQKWVTPFWLAEMVSADKICTEIK